MVDFTAELDTSTKGESYWMSRMAFAKMLQIEAKQIYGVETRIVVVDPKPWGDDCFPCLGNKITFVSDSSELKVAELEQEQWLGEKAKLLEASPGVWQDGLYILQQHYRSKSARYASEISVPYMSVDRMTPGLTEWKYVPELLDLLRVDPMCCTLPLIESSSPVLYFDSRFPLQTDPLVQMLQDTNSPGLVLVGASTDNDDRNESLLLKLSGYAVQFVSQGSPGYSEAAKYCFLQRAGFALLGSLDSPLSVWAAMANHEAQIIRLVDVDTKEASRLDTVTYPANDPRSRIQIQVLSPS